MIRKFLIRIQWHVPVLVVGILLILKLNAQARNPGDMRISLSHKNMPLFEVFRDIEKQTDLILSYSNDGIDLNRKISIQASQILLKDALKRILDATNYNFLLKNGSIVIFKTENFRKENNLLNKNLVDSLLTVTGKVIDEKGVPIAGASVIIKGTTKGTNTEKNGFFVIRGVAKKAVIIVSSVGYLKKEIFVSDKFVSQTIILNEYIEKLDEAIVIAYDITSQRKNPGGVSIIKSSEIEKKPVTNLLLALQAEVPGVTIEQATGMANAGIKVRIRGENSLTNGSDPLYVIDGVPYISQLLPTVAGAGVLGSSGGTLNSVQINGNPLSFLNPADIESISVLKDADATSIYGSRAANGAILITTKKGKPGKVKIDLSIQKGNVDLARKVKLFNAKQYLEMRHEAKINDGVPILSTDYDINGTWDTTRSTDWQKELLGKSAQYTDAQVSLSGGSPNTQFLIGGGYHYETSVMPGEFGNRKGSALININNISPNQKFKVQFSGSYMFDNNNVPGKDLTSLAMTIAPVAPKLYSTNGALNWATLANGSSSWNNPLSSLLNKTYIKNSNLIGSLMLNYKIISGLEIKTNFGYTNLQSRGISLYPLSAIIPENRVYNTAVNDMDNGNINSWIIEPQLTYDKNIGKGHLNILVGSTVQQSNASRTETYAYGAGSDVVLPDLGAAVNIYGLSDVSVYKYNAIFSRVGYTLKEKYIINLAGRRDGSSRFGKQSRFHDFWSIAGAWIFSDETLFKNIPFLKFGKLRGSYGTSGNDQIGDYKYLNTYNQQVVETPYQSSIGLIASGLPNPYLQWEETKKMQIGLDLGFLEEQKILLDVNYYLNRSSNQLLGYTLPFTTGFSSIIRNFPATLQNSGWEISLNSTNIRSKDFSWTTNFNLTIPQNKLISFPNLASSSYASSYVIGKSYNILKVYDYAGVDTTTGLYQFKDVHGNYTSNPAFATDRTVLMNILPRFFGGLQNSFKYKSLQLDLLFQFVKQEGQDNFSVLGRNPGYFSGQDNLGNQPISVLNRWKKVGDESKIQKFSSRYSSNVNIPYSRARNSDLPFSDASFIRLKNISVSWQCPKKWCDRIKFENCKFYLHGQNLLTLTHFKGLDPETKSSMVLPPLRVWTIGVQATL